MKNSFLLNEDPIGVLFHPSGLHLVVIFSEKLIIMNIYPKCLGYKKRGTRELNFKNISVVEFSNGGDKLAVADGNPQIIYIYKFYTCEKIYHLIFKGHSGTITSLRFFKKDTVLYSSGTDGIVYEWNMHEGYRKEIITKGAPINDIAFYNKKNTLYLAVNDKKSLIEYNEKFKKKKDLQLVLSQIKISKNEFLMFGAAAPESQNKSGIIRYFKNMNNFTQFEDFTAHDEKGVIKFGLTFKDGFLISVGYDGLVCVFSVQDREHVELLLPDDNAKYSNGVLVSKNEIEELMNRKESLTNYFYDNSF